MEGLGLVWGRLGPGRGGALGQAGEEQEMKGLRSPLLPTAAPGSPFWEDDLVTWVLCACEEVFKAL